MKNKILITTGILFSLIFLSCDNTEAIKVKNIYYKLYSEKDSLIGFSLRKYVFSQDTISEKYLTIDLKGKKKYDYKQSFYKKDGAVFIFSNIKNDTTKFLYFSPAKKDTCIHIDRMLGNFHLCNKGKVKFKKYNDAYKVLYNERGYDSRKETLILDSDYTILARFEDCYDYRKEIIVENNAINDNVKLQLDKASEELLWW